MCIFEACAQLSNLREVHFHPTPHCSNVIVYLLQCYCSEVLLQQIPAGLTYVNLMFIGPCIILIVE